MFYQKFGKDKFIMRSLVLFSSILPTGSRVFYHENPLSQLSQVVHHFANALRRDNNLDFSKALIACLTKNSYLSLNALVLVDPSLV